MPNIDLTQLSFSTIISAIFIVSALVGVIITFVKFINNLKNVSHEKMAHKENIENEIKKHAEGLSNINEKIDKGLSDVNDKVDKKLSDVNEKIDKISMSVDNLGECMKIQLRHSIVAECENALEKEYIEFYRLQAIEDMYETYSTVLKGNSYVKTVVKKVRCLKVINRDDTDMDEKD